MRRDPGPRHVDLRSERASLSARIRKAVAAHQVILSRRLRTLRLERKLTQEAAAELMGIHEKHLQRIEAGKENVTLATLVGAAVTYGVELSELFHKP